MRHDDTAQPAAPRGSSRPGRSAQSEGDVCAIVRADLDAIARRERMERHKAILLAANLSAFLEGL